MTESDHRAATMISTHTAKNQDNDSHIIQQDRGNDQDYGHRSLAAAQRLQPITSYRFPMTTPRIQLPESKV
jgi:hypothetical protein